MTCAAASMPVDQRASLSPRAMTIFGFVAAITFSASSGAPTPLYRVYQQDFGLSPLLLTVIFSAYVFSLLAALLTVGSLSDYVGRRPVIFAALALNAAAMLIFIEANSAVALIAARIIQGLATGAAITTLGAAILDTNRVQGPLLNSIWPFAGLTLGTLGSGALVAFAPDPTQLVYVVLMAATVLQAAAVWFMPETTRSRPGAFASLRPHVSVPPQARQSLMRVTPVNVATWALGGFYFSLMPSLVQVATGLASPFVGGVTVAALPFTATIAVVLFRERPAVRALATGTVTLVSGVVITLAGVHVQQVGLLILGTILAGLGFGATFSGTLRTVLPLASAGERAGLLSAFYVESYLAFSIPAILAGLVAPILGLPLSAYIYGSAVIVLAMTSLMATRGMRKGSAPLIPAPTR